VHHSSYTPVEVAAGGFAKGFRGLNLRSAFRSLPCCLSGIVSLEALKGDVGSMACAGGGSDQRVMGGGKVEFRGSGW